jgi:acetyl esterase/lipase
MTPETAAVVRAWEAAVGPARGRTPQGLRKAYADVATLLDREPVASVTDRTTLSAGAGVPVRIYRPVACALGPMTTKPAVLVWFHGGGWTVGDLEVADAPCRALANRVGVVVVSVGYRLAPEHPFPAALDDATATVRWVVAHGSELGIDARRLAVGGDSAGGNLAAVVCQQLRAGGPAISFQLLVYPVTDGRLSSPSMTDFAEGYGLGREEMDWYWRQYVGDRARDDPRMSPLRAPDDALVGLPPAIVISAELDPLRDEGEAYGRRLRAAGVDCEIARYRRMVHGFYSLPGVVPAARTAIQQAADAVGRVVAPPAQPEQHRTGRSSR